jgi:hypothetical protein
MFDWIQLTLPLVASLLMVFAWFSADTPDNYQTIYGVELDQSSSLRLGRLTVFIRFISLYGITSFAFLLYINNEDINNYAIILNWVILY